MQVMEIQVIPMWFFIEFMANLSTSERSSQHNFHIHQKY